MLSEALSSCRSRRDLAVVLHDSGHHTRAARRLKLCFDLLGLSATGQAPKVSAPSEDALRARATREIERALALKPDVANGLQVYRECAACPSPEGWGLPHGSVPQIAGQHRSVVVKQLADIRVGNRENGLMAPYASVESIGGAQAIADVAAYIESLEISLDSGKGSGNDLELGERLYRENCARCHGATGEGDSEIYAPRIQSQHYSYLVYQFQRIRDGKRRNANPEMASQIQGFGEREIRAVLDYVSRLEPPAELQAPPGWKNPDFVE